MNLATTLSFSGVMLAATAAPGPAMFYALDCGTRRGLRPALLAAFGVSLMAVVYAALALAGLAAVLRHYGELYGLLRCGGALYLLYCGYRALKASGRTGQEPPDTVRPAPGTQRRLFLDAVLLGASNPKGILFFAALFPQFLPRNLVPTDSVLILAITFASSMAGMMSYAAGGASFARVLRRPQVRKRVARTTALIYGAFGLRLLLDRS
ncbi:LysE family translocator [Paludibacterium yongneupense]|uniref:LysE family translocator n=1 Tax=Paludibacterium yongneupense TaxID=400061 RepID=UPI00041E99AF|nr:LysE family translocator [Paludibacterium yongneupense]